MIKNKYGKIVIGMLLVTLLALTNAQSAKADGLHFSAEYLYLYEPAQKAVIFWDGTTQIMYLSSAVKSDNLTDIAWVVPIISTTKPNVTAGNMSVFKELVNFFGEYYYWDFHFRKSDNYLNEGNVSIIEICEIDIYDVIILKATNASDLIDWLVKNNLKVPNEAYDIIDRYVRMENCYFVINKIDLKNRFKDVIEQIENGTSPDNFVEYQKIIDDLKIGMATPLRFQFTPPQPYYPLVISSLNAGEGRIDVYVIAEKPVADINMVMQLEKIKNMTSDLKKTLQEFFPIDKEEYITKLTYNGLLKDLTDDAVFDFFTTTPGYKPVFIFIPSNLKNLTGNLLVDIMVYDQNGGLLELNYRIDGKGPWLVAERTDMAYIYGKWWKIFEYNAYVPEEDGAIWTLEIDAANLTDGNHTIEIRVLHKIYNNWFYTPVYQYDFTTIKNNNENLKLANNNVINATLISGLVIISIISIVVIDRKTKFEN